jgi:hypothetical protein
MPRLGLITRRPSGYKEKKGLRGERRRLLRATRAQKGAVAPYLEGSILHRLQQWTKTDVQQVNTIIFLSVVQLLKLMWTLRDYRLPALTNTNICTLYRLPALTDTNICTLYRLPALTDTNICTLSPLRLADIPTSNRNLSSKVPTSLSSQICCNFKCTVELGYNVMKGTEYFVSL